MFVLLGMLQIVCALSCLLQPLTYFICVSRNNQLFYSTRVCLRVCVSVEHQPFPSSMCVFLVQLIGLNVSCALATAPGDRCCISLQHISLDN